MGASVGDTAGGKEAGLDAADKKLTPRSRCGWPELTGGRKRMRLSPPTISVATLPHRFNLKVKQMRVIIGIVMVVVLLGGLFYLVKSMIGWRPAVVIFSAAIGVTVWLVIAGMLIEGKL